MMDRPSESKHRDLRIRKSFLRANDLIASGDIAEAEMILLDNCNMSCSDSMVLLGCIRAEGTEGGKHQALEWFTEAANLGDSSGMRNAGYCFALGIGCEQEKSEAVRWYRMAAEAGNAKAQCNLGVMFEFGNGVKKDYSEAARWFLESAENGYSRGQTNIGILLMEGRGVTQDEEAAERWFRASGTPRANYNLARILLDPDYGHSNRAEALSLLEESSSSGYVKAMSFLAELLANEDERKSEKLKQEVLLIYEARSLKRRNRRK